jgi:hypothetical protein
MSKMSTHRTQSPAEIKRKTAHYLEDPGVQHEIQELAKAIGSYEHALEIVASLSVLYDEMPAAEKMTYLQYYLDTDERVAQEREQNRKQEIVNARPTVPTENQNQDQDEDEDRNMERKKKKKNTHH